jgi:hypothetical protein
MFSGMPDGTREQSPAEDDIDRALRELSEGITGEARFKEPSAKERAKAAKRPSRQARKQAKARARQAPEPSAGWRGGYRYDLPARELRRQGRRASRRVVKAVAWTGAIVILAGSGVFAYQHFAKKHGGAAAAISSAPGLSPVEQSDGGPPADPFAGTPADQWANGAAGIVVPAATAVGPFTASQVAAAYETTRKLLIAQDLDHTALLGGAPTAFANLLVPKQRSQFIAGLDKIGTKSGEELSTRSWVASFAPGTTALIGSVIKVHGSMSARATTDDGNSVLQIDVNYRFAYPVEPPRAPQDWMRVVREVSNSVEFGNWKGVGGSFVPWLLTKTGDAGIRCDSVDGFIHPDYPSSSPDKVQPSGPAFNPYSLQDQPTDKCQVTTGT